MWNRTYDGIKLGIEQRVEGGVVKSLSLSSEPLPYGVALDIAKVAFVKHIMNNDPIGDGL